MSWGTPGVAALACQNAKVSLVRLPSSACGLSSACHLLSFVRLLRGRVRSMASHGARGSRAASRARDSAAQLRSTASCRAPLPLPLRRTVARAAVRDLADCDQSLLKTADAVVKAGPSCFASSRSACAR